MSFIDNILENLGLDGLNYESDRITLIGGKAGYFEGIKSIKSYTTTCVVLELKKGKINIKGENLYIKKLCGSDILLCGKIDLVERT